MSFCGAGGTAVPHRSAFDTIASLFAPRSRADFLHFNSAKTHIYYFKYNKFQEPLSTLDKSAQRMYSVSRKSIPICMDRCAKIANGVRWLH